MSHGEVYIMTRSSQNLYDHAVDRLDPTAYELPRISITYRVLRSPAPPNARAQRTQRVANSQKSSPSRYPNSSSANRKRVLILSDSKNSTFDCTAFRDPIAFRSNLFYLRDLADHSEAIKQSDIVLISAGINDIKTIE